MTCAILRAKSNDKTFRCSWFGFIDYLKKPSKLQKKKQKCTKDKHIAQRNLSTDTIICRCYLSSCSL